MFSNALFQGRLSSLSIGRLQVLLPIKSDGGNRGIEEAKRDKAQREAGGGRGGRGERILRRRCYIWDGGGEETDGQEVGQRWPKVVGE